MIAYKTINIDRKDKHMISCQLVDVYMVLLHTYTNLILMVVQSFYFLFYRLRQWICCEFIWFYPFTKFLCYDLDLVEYQMLLDWRDACDRIEYLYFFSSLSPFPDAAHLVAITFHVSSLGFEFHPFIFLLFLYI